MHLIASLGLLCIVMGLSGGAWYLWERWGDPIIPAGRYLGEAGIVLIFAAAIASWCVARRLPKLKDFLDERIWTLGLVAILVSDWICRPWGLYQGPLIRGEIVVGALAMYALLRGPWQRVLLFWPIATVAMIIWSFFLASRGSILFSDDHAMFLFRLKLLKENFPQIPFWFPLWNGGIDARDFFATGALNAFFLSAPLLYSFPVETVYNLIIALILWVLTPLSVYFAARLIGSTTLQAAISSTLSVCSGLFWYRWGLKYGTVGFIVSTALFPLVVALVLRFISETTPRWRLCLALTVASSLMLLWSPSGIAALPLALIALPRVLRIITSRRHLATLALIAALNLPWMAMMWKVSNVGRFLESHKETTAGQHEVVSLNNGGQPLPGSQGGTAYRHKSGGIDKQKSLNQWHNNASALNPLLVVFALPALLTLSGATRVSFSLLSAWLMALGTIGVTLKPQLELDRMIIIASMLLTLPVGILLSRLFALHERGRSWRIAGSIAGSFLLIGPFAASSVTLNRSDDTYKFANGDVQNLVAVIGDHAGSGRAFFTGCVLHELSGGHLGPLPLWSNVPMVASSYAHNIWKYEQPIPQAFMEKGDAGIREYLDLMNASLVIAHEPVWIDYLRSRPTEYQLLMEGPPFFAFKRLQHTPSFALSGDIADLSHTTNSLSFVANSESLVLKFKYFPFLQSSHCDIQPRQVSKDIYFIELTNCPRGERVTISSVSPIKRLLTRGM